MARTKKPSNRDDSVAVNFRLPEGVDHSIAVLIPYMQSVAPKRVRISKTHLARAGLMLAVKAAEKKFAAQLPEGYVPLP